MYTHYKIEQNKKRYILLIHYINSLTHTIDGKKEEPFLYTDEDFGYLYVYFSLSHIQEKGILPSLPREIREFFCKGKPITHSQGLPIQELIYLKEFFDIHEAKVNFCKKHSCMKIKMGKIKISFYKAVSLLYKKSHYIFHNGTHFITTFLPLPQGREKFYLKKIRRIIKDKGNYAHFPFLSYEEGIRFRFMLKMIREFYPIRGDISWNGEISSMEFSLICV